MKKKVVVFCLFFFAQNIDRGYTLELLYWGVQRVPTIYVLEQKIRKNVHTSKPHFTV